MARFYKKIQKKMRRPSGAIQRDAQARDMHHSIRGHAGASGLELAQVDSQRGASWHVFPGEGTDVQGVSVFCTRAFVVGEMGITGCLC